MQDSPHPGPRPGDLDGVRRGVRERHTAVRQHTRKHLRAEHSWPGDPATDPCGRRSVPMGQPALGDRVPFDDFPHEVKPLNGARHVGPDRGRAIRAEHRNRQQLSPHRRKDRFAAGLRHQVRHAHDAAVRFHPHHALEVTVGVEDLVGAVTGVRKHYPAIAKDRESIRIAEFARPLALPSERAAELAVRAHDEDAVDLGVEHIQLPHTIERDPAHSPELLPVLPPQRPHPVHLLEVGGDPPILAGQLNDLLGTGRSCQKQPPQQQPPQHGLQPDESPARSPQPSAHFAVSPLSTSPWVDPPLPPTPPP